LLGLVCLSVRVIVALLLLLRILLVLPSAPTISDHTASSLAISKKVPSVKPLIGTPPTVMTIDNGSYVLTAAIF
jgi:hypothetical protein